VFDHLGGRMKRYQFSLCSWLLVGAAAPIWLVLIVTVPQSTGFGGSGTRFIMAPLVLLGITAAVHRLLRDRPSAWALSALIAAVICLGSLCFAAWMSA
jgi:hypothetical protein